LLFFPQLLPLDFEDIENVLKAAQDKDKPKLQETLNDKIVSKLKKGTNQATEDAKKLNRIYVKIFGQRKKVN